MRKGKIKRYFIYMFILSFSLLTGCNNSKVVGQENYYSDNFILGEYKANIENARKIEISILDYLYNKNCDLTIDDSYLSSAITLDKIRENLSPVRDYAFDVQYSNRDLNIGADYFKDKTTVSYFMNRDSGALDDFIMLKDGGNIYKINLVWIGGLITDATVSYYN